MNTTLKSFVLAILLLIVTGSAAGAILSTTPNVVEIAPPPSVDFDVLEDDTLIRAFNEKQSFVLLSDVSVDISSPGIYELTGQLTPAVLSAGSVVHSHFFHFDRVGFGGARHTSGSVTFDEEILGVIVTKGQLDSTDSLLGAPGTSYISQPGSRGLEFYPQDAITLESDMRTVTITNWTALDVLDQMRVVTVREPVTLSLLAVGVLALRRRGA